MVAPAVLAAPAGLAYVEAIEPWPERDPTTTMGSTSLMARTMILPGVLRYQGEVAKTVSTVKALGFTLDTALIEKICGLVATFEKQTDALEKVMAHHAGSVTKEAAHLCDVVLPAMKELRKTSDTLEGLVAHDLWGIPQYEDMLFIK